MRSDPLGGDWEGPNGRTRSSSSRGRAGKEEGRTEGRDEGRVRSRCGGRAAAVDFAIRAFNIKPRAINGQASQRARGGAGRKEEEGARPNGGGREGSGQ